MAQSPFFVIESIDAAGGSTQARLLTQKLKKEGFEVLPLHFPQKNRPTGQLIYDKFLHVKNKGRFSKREQALLYIQDFFSAAPDIARHLAKQGKTAVVSDRYFYSTLAYQTAGTNGDARKKILAWLTWLTQQDSPSLPQPTAVFFLDLPVSLIGTRLDERNADFFEDVKKQQPIRRSYLALKKPSSWHTIVAGTQEGPRSRTEIHDTIWTLAQPYLKR